MKKLSFLLLFLGIQVTVFAQKIERIYVFEPDNHPFIAVGNNIFEYLIKGVEKQELKTYLPSSKALDLSKTITKKEFFEAISVQINNNEKYVHLKGEDFQLLEIQYDKNIPKVLDIEYLSMSIAGGKPIKARFDFQEVTNYLEQLFKKSLIFKTIQNVEAGYYDLKNQKIEISIGEALKTKMYKVLSEDNNYNFSLEEKNKLKKIKKINAPIWLKIEKNQYHTLVNYRLDSRSPFNITNNFRDSLSYKLYQLDTLTHQNWNTNYQNLIKLIVEGIQKGKIIPQNMRADTYQNIESQKQNMSVAEFNAYLNNIKPEDLMMRLQISYVRNEDFTKVYQDISHITLIIPQGASSLSQMGSVAFAEIPFQQIAVYVNNIYNQSQKNSGFWASADNPNQKLSLTQALKEGKYKGFLVKYVNWNDDDFKVMLENTEEFENIEDKEKENYYFKILQESGKNMAKK